MIFSENVPILLAVVNILALSYKVIALKARN